MKAAVWSEQCAQQLVRYEALFKLLDDIQGSEDVELIAKIVSKQWKYFSNVSCWRMVIAWELGYQVIDGCGGDATVTCPKFLPEWEAHHWSLKRPQCFAKEELTENPMLPDCFNGGAIKEIKLLPFDRGDQRIAMLTVAARNYPFNDLDRRFIHLFSGYLVDKLASILLREAALKSLTNKATYDFLTGLYNRAVVIDRLESNLLHSYRMHQPLSVILADVDYFKSVNDTYGHVAGDEVLQEISLRFKKAVRSGEVVGRYGGEEFLFVLYPCCGKEAASAAKRFCQIIRDMPVKLVEAGNENVRVTMSLGVASTEGYAKSQVKELLKRADFALYKAKSAGRDRICIDQ